MRPTTTAIVIVASFLTTIAAGVGVALWRRSVADQEAAAAVDLRVARVEGRGATANAIAKIAALLLRLV